MMAERSQAVISIALFGEREAPQPRYSGGSTTRRKWLLEEKLNSSPLTPCFPCLIQTPAISPSQFVGRSGRKALAVLQGHSGEGLHPRSRGEAQLRALLPKDAQPQRQRTSSLAATFVPLTPALWQAPRAPDSAATLRTHHHEGF